MKTILITGGCGFLGHHLVEHILKNTDYNIKILDSLSYAGNLHHLTDIKIWEKEYKRVHFIWHDFKAPITNEIDKRIGEIDYIVHLAAETHVDRSLVDCIPFVMSNVLGTANLLNWLKTKKNWMENGKGIIFSTDEVFGNAEINESFEENSPYRPSNPYAATKVGEEALAYSFIHSYKLPLMILRCTNLFGERQNPEKFIPLTIRNAFLEKEITIHVNHNKLPSLRQWVHCRTVSDAICFLLNKGKTKEFYHVVGEEKNVSEIVSIICKAINKVPKITFKNCDTCRPGHDFRYSIQNNNLFKLGWKSNIDLNESLIKTSRWSIMKGNIQWLQI